MNTSTANLGFRYPLFIHSQVQSRTQFRHRFVAISAPASAYTQIDLVKNNDGMFVPKKSKVAVLWDLDNKPPRGPPFSAAMSLRKLAESMGEVVELSAYANRHAFIHLPQWVAEERRERRELDVLERKGLVIPQPGMYTCGVCGRKCSTNLELKKHFRQLHERERQKKVNRMKSLKGKKRQRFKERFISGNVKYETEARRLMNPRVGYGLAGELKRAGFFVKTVEDRPQAADWAVKRQIEHSMNRGVDWLFLVTDDSDFKDSIKKARDAKLCTVVIGDRDRALGRHSDVWVPWEGVEAGEISQQDLISKNDFLAEDEMFTISNTGDYRSFNDDQFSEDDDENEYFSWSEDCDSDDEEGFVL